MHTIVSTFERVFRPLVSIWRWPFFRCWKNSKIAERAAIWHITGPHHFATICEFLRPTVYPQLCHNNVFQKSILTLVALCLLIGSGYLPLPIPILKDLSIPFPCQNMGCGCQNARQCWADCCCHSDQQKIEWAKANNVQPPAWFVALSVNGGTESEPHGSCCGTTCCSARPKAAPKCCCSHAATKDSSTPDSKTVFLSIKQQRHCGGQHDGYVHLDLIAIAQPPPRFSWPKSNSWLPSTTRRCADISSAPPVPPA